MRVSFLIFLFLAGCTPHAPKEVYIPVVAKCPSPLIPPKPYLPIADLKKGDKPDKVVRSYAASVVLLKGQNEQMREILEGYK